MILVTPTKTCPLKTLRTRLGKNLITTRILKTVTAKTDQTTIRTTQPFLFAIYPSRALTTSYVSTFPTLVLSVTLGLSSTTRPSDQKALALSASSAKTMQNPVSRMHQSTNLQLRRRQRTRKGEAKLWRIPYYKTKQAT